jgi:pimeloyl-ACP methyl ester carboxylesterase
VARIPITYIGTVLDRPTPIALQREMVTHLPFAAEVVELQTGHIPAVVDPAGFARLLVDGAPPPPEGVHSLR